MRKTKEQTINRYERTLEEVCRDPRLDDEGTYDYLIVDKPDDYESKIRGPRRCDSCGRRTNVLYMQEHFFYTYDGYDSMVYCECLRCHKGRYRDRVARKIKMCFRSLRNKANNKLF